MLQERLYLIEEAGGLWRVRLSPLDRALHVHGCMEDAAEVTKGDVRMLAPCRIRVIHSGQAVAEWYIRYPDGTWEEVDPGPIPELPRTVSFRKANGAKELG